MHQLVLPSGQVYFHNGDFSGMVHTEVLRPATNEMVAIQIPFEDIEALYLEARRQRAIQKLEEATADQLKEMF